jgi:hypothetical protein
MQYCPNCSAQLNDDALECHNCGAEFQPRSQGGQRQPKQGDQHQQGQTGQQGPRNQQPQQGGGHHPQQQPPHGAQQPPGQRPPPEQRQQQKIGPLTRRQALAVGGGIAVMIGAWALGVTSSSSDNPERVVRDYLDAVEARDPDAASTLVHQDSPAQDELVTPLPGAAGESSDDELQYSITVDGTEVVDRESDPAQEGVQEFATVETTITTTIESPDTSQKNTNTVQFRLARNSAGTWKLWDVSTTSTTVDDATPAVSFDFDYAPGSSGPGDGVLTITHSSGDTIEASELFVRGSGVNRVGTDPMAGFSQRFDRISTDLGRTSSVSAGVSVRLEADSDYQVTVVWEGDPAGTLGEASGPDA